MSAFMCLFQAPGLLDQILVLRTFLVRLSTTQHLAWIMNWRLEHSQMPVLVRVLVV